MTTTTPPSTQSYNDNNGTSSYKQPTTTAPSASQKPRNRQGYDNSYTTTKYDKQPQQPQRGRGGARKGPRNNNSSLNGYDVASPQLSYGVTPQQGGVVGSGGGGMHYEGYVQTHSAYAGQQGYNYGSLHGKSWSDVVNYNQGHHIDLAQQPSLPLAQATHYQTDYQTKKHYNNPQQQSPAEGAVSSSPVVVHHQAGGGGGGVMINVPPTNTEEIEYNADKKIEDIQTRLKLQLSAIEIKTEKLKKLQEDIRKFKEERDGEIEKLTGQKQQCYDKAEMLNNEILKQQRRIAQIDAEVDRLKRDKIQKVRNLDDQLAATTDFM